MSSSMLCSHGVVLATAAMAVSCTVIFLALRLQKSLPPSLSPLHQNPQSSQQVLRPCIASGKKKRKNKKVHFAEDVVDPIGDGEEFRREHGHGIIVFGNYKSSSSSSLSSSSTQFKKISKDRGMPENREALYNGILRDRMVNRLAYSY